MNLTRKPHTCGGEMTLEVWAGEWEKYHCPTCQRSVEFIRGLELTAPEEVQQLRERLRAALDELASTRAIANEYGAKL